MFSFFKKKTSSDAANLAPLPETEEKVGINPKSPVDGIASSAAVTALVAAPAAKQESLAPDRAQLVSSPENAAVPAPDGLAPAPAAAALAWLKRTFKNAPALAPEVASAPTSVTQPAPTPTPLPKSGAASVTRVEAVPLPDESLFDRLSAAPVAQPQPQQPPRSVPGIDPTRRTSFPDASGTSTERMQTTTVAKSPFAFSSSAGKTGSVAVTSEAATPALTPKAAPIAPLLPTVQLTTSAEATLRAGWMQRLRAGLKKTGTGLSTVFTGTKIDEALYEELEDALLMADTGVKATQFLLTDLKRRVKDARITEVNGVRALLADAIADLLRPLEKSLVIGEFKPTVIMVAGVNGAGKTTSIGKLTHHLAGEGATVLLAAADTFRAAAREQLGVWADRNTVEIIGQQGHDPAAVSFDAVTAGKARGRDVVLVDTAGRLPTQVHLMEELKKIKRVVQKADATAPHEILLVIDGNTGQNAVAQVKAFDDALGLTGLIVTKLDGTAKGGVLAAIAQERPVPVYFVGVGESLLDLETFNAREFAQALLG